MKMKKFLITLLVAAPALVLAQVKPSIPKAEKALREGKIDEAKTIIDATTGSQEFMVDKKGQPTKNAAKAWYLRGLIYFAMDTTSKAQFKSLDPDAFAQGKEAFDKSKAIEPQAESYFNDASGLNKLLNSNVNLMLGNSYFNQAINAYNEENDYKKALKLAEKTQYFMPTDTTLLFYSSAFAMNAEAPDKALKYLEGYLNGGGRDPKAYASMANIYLEQKKTDAALQWIKEGQSKFPAYRDLRLLELNLYLDAKKYDVAKDMVEKELKSDPNNRDNHFLYGQLNRELGNNDVAKASFKKALEIDPKFFDAARDLADLYWQDAKKYKDEIGKLGNSKEDLKKKQSLDGPYVDALKAFVPHIEAAEKLSPDDITILYSLLNAYSELDDQPKAARVKKRLKALGEDI